MSVESDKLKLEELMKDVETTFEYNNKLNAEIDQLLGLSTESNNIDTSNSSIIPPINDMIDQAANAAKTKISDTLDQAEDIANKVEKAIDILSNPGKIIDDIKEGVQKVQTASSQILQQASGVLKGRTPDLSSLPRASEKEQINNADKQKNGAFASARADIEAASSSAIGGVTSALKDITAKGKEIYDKASGVVNDVVGEVSSTVNNAIGQALTTFNSVNNEIESSLKPLVDKYKQIESNLIAAGETVTTNLNDFLGSKNINPDNLKMDLNKLGFNQESMDYISGLDDKIAEQVQSVKDKASNITNAVSNAIGGLFSAMDQKKDKFDSEASNYASSLNESEAQKRSDSRKYKDNPYLNIKK